MNIQIFGKKKSALILKKQNDILRSAVFAFQRIDLLRYGMSAGEFSSVLSAVGGVDALLD